jgi:glycosyltransferase involved in cell wall biosynthesis
VRVLVVTQMWPSAAAPQLGAFVARQVEAMRALGATVEVASIPPAPGGIRAPLKWRRLHAAARRAARDFRPEVVHGHFLFPAGESARRAAAACGVPLVVTCHGQDVVNAETSAWLRGRTQRVLDGSDALIGVSAALTDRLGLVCRLPQRIEHVDMGIDVAAFTPGDRDVAAHSFGPEPSRPLVVSVGVKNAERLARAVEIVRERTGGGELWFVGPGDTPVAGHVRSRGLVDPAVVARVLRAADCVALVSEREGYGIAALEAMACGVPLVVSAGIPVAADVPATAGVAVDAAEVEAIAAGIERALLLDRSDPAALAAAAAHDVRLQARRVLDVLSAVRHRAAGAGRGDDRIG